MKKLNKLILAVTLTFFVFSCDDILEENISSDSIQITFPVEGTIIQGNIVQFSWQNLDGADDYRLQIINDNQVYLIDSLVSSTTFNYNLNPGNYQWRIRGENFAYETPYTFPIDFSVQESIDLTNQNVELLTPSVNYYTNNPNIIFTWSSITSDELYSFELIKNIGGQQTIFQESNLSETTLSINQTLFNEDAEYIWNAKAVNTNSETPYSSRSIFMDREVPNQPTLTSPIDQYTSSPSLITFTWQNGSDTGNIQSTITNTIEISFDINFNTIINSTSTINNTTQFTLNNTGTYYWRVRAKDEANNQSDYSTVRVIVIE